MKALGVLSRRYNFGVSVNFWPAFLPHFQSGNDIGVMYYKKSTLLLVGMHWLRIDYILYQWARYKYFYNLSALYLDTKSLYQRTVVLYYHGEKPIWPVIHVFDRSILSKNISA